jgi:hypothetical protein
VARGAKHPIDREMRWNFGDSRGTSLSLDEFLAQKEAAGVEFFAGKEPWLVGLHKYSIVRPDGEIRVVREVASPVREKEVCSLAPNRFKFV